MSYNLVLVGGTGQQFGVILAWLNQIGLMKPPRRTILIDANVTENFDRINHGLRYGNPEYEHFHILPYRNAGAQTTLVGELQANSANSPLLNQLFTQNECDLPLNMGFFANPKIGATVFSYHQEQANILRLLNSTVLGLGPTIIVGSVSGGTGAGLMYSVARLFAQARGHNYSQSPIVGFIFTKYLQLNDQQSEQGNVTNAQLHMNSFQGVRFLWDHSRSDPNFPFDMLDVFGPPESDQDPRYVPPVEEGPILPFPGFLMATQLLSQGSTSIFDSLKAHLSSFDPNTPLARFFGIHLHSAHSDHHYLNGNQVKFDQLVASDFNIYLSEINDVLNTLIDFDIEGAVSTFSLWPLRRIPAPIVDYLLAGGQRLSKVQLLESFNTLRDEARSLLNHLNEGSDSFASWFKRLRGFGYADNNPTESPRLERVEWLEALGVVNGLDHESARAILREICLAQISKRPQNAVRNQPPNLFWAFPYRINQQTPQQLGRCLITAGGQLVDVGLSGGEGLSFPTPLGRVEGFRVDLAQAIAQDQYNDPVYVQTQMIWYGLALGELSLQTINLERESTLERVVGQFLPKNMHKVMSLLLDKEGKVLGGSHPTCGFWVGMSSILHHSALQECVNNITKANLARAILHQWFVQIQPQVQATNGVLPVWARFLQHHLIQRYMAPASQLDLGDLGTHAPVQLQTGASEIRLLFLPRYSPMRRQLLSHLIYSLVSDQSIFKVRYEMGMEGRTRLICTFNHKDVASIHLGSRRTVVPQDQAELALAEGCFTVDFMDFYPVSYIPQADLLEKTFSERVAHLVNVEIPKRYGINLQSVYQHVSLLRDKPDLFNQHN